MNLKSQAEINAHLIQTSEGFRQLAHRHREYDRMVAALESKHVLTAEEELEEHRLKKLKLHLKDEMQQITGGFKLQQAGR